MKAALIKLILILSAKLPLSLNHAFGRFLGRRLINSNATEKKTAQTNISLCFPYLSSQEHQHLLEETLIESGKTITESGLVWLCSKEKFENLVKEVHGEEHLKAGLEKGKGVILAVPHLGNWEAIGMYCSPRYPMTSLYRPPRVSGLDDIIRTARQRFGAKLVPTDASGVKALLKALKNNEITAILPDQDPRDNGGEFAPFFGIQANTMTLLSKLVQKSGATVLCAYAQRLPNSKGFAVHFAPVNDGIYSQEISTSVTAINQAIEDAVQKCPEQYQWSYKRFRTRPQGETEIYDQ